MIIIGSLLWIDVLNHSAVNNKNKKIESYFKQLDVLSKTLNFSLNCELHIFTNHPEIIREWFVSTGRTCPVLLKISSSYHVPEGTPFFGAHYKLEALDLGRKLLKSSDDRFLLLDADVFAVKPFGIKQLEIIESSDLIVYDISDQVFPAYGFDRIKNDLEKVAGAKFENPIWYGGEFICGSAVGIDKLLFEVRELFPRYIESIKNLHHVGDEMFVSAALNLLFRNSGGLVLVDQKNLKLVSRHWSRFVNPSINWHFQHNFVHCPGSKPLLEFLSSLKNPSKIPFKILFKIYSLVVRFYQFSKKFKNN